MRKTPPARSHLSVKLLHAFWGNRLSILRDAFFYIHCSDTVLNLLMSDLTHPNCQFHCTNTRTVISHGYHLLEWFLILVFALCNDIDLL